MKKFTLALAMIALVSCTPETSEVSNNYKVPKELSDCSFFKMENTAGGAITVVRCPNSETSTTEHKKNPTTTITTEN